MIIAIAAMAASALAGILLHRRDADSAKRIGGLCLDVLVWVVQPFVMVVTLPSLHVDGALAAGLGLGYVTIGLMGVTAWLIGSRVLKLDRPSLGTLICGAIIVNTGYFGLPFVTALLGHAALAPALAWDAVISGPAFYVFGWLVGGRFGHRAAGHSVAGTLLRNPPLFAAIVGFSLPASAIPHGLASAGHDGVWAMLALGFVALGVTLAAEARHGDLDFPRLSSAELTGLLIRLALAPTVFLALSSFVHGIPGAFRVSAALPVGLTTLVVARHSGLNLRLAATLIAWTSVIAAIWGLIAAAT